ncbi:unnamed protein product [Penicillium salamii]|uniref:DUF7492 domain-containing protein n=1 Tax=Penicillium salamii TaxID=1612424 RepID=A0A9W4MZ19_9EURO|nr:unnamed protein product [Penicillium salamii]CAG8064345.1 unnamed protein product [Penicillium salamii]CAG8195178.1 unnamed protein product [Penicillium salamii]CAG8213556.1 unnamed protein product [Penicillium salamii]CAG8229080.1 unnamed protein product [Penicillium salamii]
MMLAIILIVLFALNTPINAHSWIEQLTLIAPNGTFVGTPGYPRGNYLRSTSGYSDTTMTYLIPPGSRANVTEILPTDKLCKDTQQEQKQSDGSPRLEASAGAAIALRFQENGHVTLPQNQPGKPPNRGTVYVYGTTQPKTGEKFLDVHGAWTADGTGGDGRGVLLSKQNFDDGRCYQVNSGEISGTRQAKFTHTANQLMGADLWCQQDIQLPSNAPSGKPYTLYWVWDWPTAAGADPTYPNGKAEIYTTCMEVDVVTTVGKQAVNDEYDIDQDLNQAAIPAQFDSLGDGVSVQASGTTPAAPSTQNTQTTLTTMARSATAVAATTARRVTVTDWETSTSTVYMSLPT